MLFGNLWSDLDPWTGPARWLRRALRPPRPHRPRPPRRLPAVAGLLAFTWFELVSLAPDDPAVLARTVLGYWLTSSGSPCSTAPAWLLQGESLSVLFGFIAKHRALLGEPRPAAVRG